jgi:hypothetical protein
LKILPFLAITFSEKASLAPGVLDHGLHRVNFTCWVCHVDFAFAMKMSRTNVKASDNANGYLLRGCSEKVAFPLKNWFRCHTKPVNWELVLPDNLHFWYTHAGERRFPRRSPTFS